jgi:hypothetical protein
MTRQLRSGCQLQVVIGSNVVWPITRFQVKKTRYKPLHLFLLTFGSLRRVKKSLQANSATEASLQLVDQNCLQHWWKPLANWFHPRRFRLRWVARRSWNFRHYRPFFVQQQVRYKLLTLSTLWIYECGWSQQVALRWWSWSPHLLNFLLPVIHTWLTTWQSSTRYNYEIVSHVRGLSPPSLSPII